MLNNVYNLHIISIASVVGLLLDLILQISTRYLNLGGNNGWGLKSYFLHHGTFESLFIASGMMSILFIIYLYILPLKLNYFNLALYGILIDIIFRKTMVFKELSGYYRIANYLWTALWSSLAMMLPLFIFHAIKSYKII